MKRRGVALISILIVAAALLAIVSAGLKLGSDGVLFASQAHKRNVALGAAEAGVYEAVVRLQADRTFSGSVSGTLAQAGSTYSLTIDNQLASSGVAVVTSTGTFGHVSRTVRVELEPDSKGFESLSLNGQVYVYERVYANAISSVTERLVRPGHIHSEFTTDDTYVGEPYSASRTTYPPRLHATGDIATAGGDLKNSDLDMVAFSENTNESHSRYSLNRGEMMMGGFGSPVSSLPSGNVVSANTQLLGDVDGNVRFEDPVRVNKGATLYITGNAEFMGGLVGEGKVVVDENVAIRPSSHFDDAVEGGIKLYVGDSAIIVHPDVGTDSEGFTIPETDDSKVGDYFARMPMEAALELPTGIPLAAPQGADFYRWYHEKLAESDPGQEFTLWREGDGSELYPGLSFVTKKWLGESSGLVSDIEGWANN